MAELFSPAWMERFAAEWNREPDLAQALGQIDFASNIAYGFVEEEAPRGFLQVLKGQVASAGAYQGQALNWDIRASVDQWMKWISSPPGMTGLGMAFTTGKIKFKVGDYKSMLKDPRMATPFVKSFSVMARV
ncbi:MULTISPECIES: hypothetical protein [Acidithiobacillus]|jgi:hypothetical protein|uniref:SCP-2 sterol transfer family protein n=2 Tax=Acidithiobacillus caldus TaxID=33059 RepID=F9ZLW6_ACICS|nr:MULTISPECIES: hypothetical protein [Acidithiobacillus]AEK57448.1 conserved hypothetical protein [Acidithiobacillus caldus SM-1]AIA54659.1 hypothetical protein Acaty_c0782 [Acidithiobacillus caldus ATCC 51756]MBU2729275.1 SCP-2 sterol transfer family protein [Acidithiobacillus caldus]MBU2735899.1 SCP-2 sterol transfer family protein [Acidithiobacillus caldus ATCC 51756]MBU2745230.1 SCP-2 sterol transfer family protein [Acidithiobacillus caldus]